MKFGGDTYFYPVKPEPDQHEELVRVFGDIYKCANKPVVLNPHVDKSIRKNPNFQVETIRFVHPEYQRACNVLQGCEAGVKLQCNFGSRSVFRRCYTLLKRDMLPLEADAILLGNVQGKYDLTGTTYNCPASMLTVLPITKSKKFTTGVTDYVPELQDIDAALIPTFQGGDSVTVTNMQLSTDTKLFYKWGTASFYGNLKQASDLLAKQLEHEISKRGFKIVNGASKRLKVSVVSIQTNYTKWHKKGSIAFEVVDGNGKKYSKLIGGADIDVNDLINRMVANSVVDILNYYQIRDYLTKK